MQLKNIAILGVSAAVAAVGIGVGAGGSAYADNLLGSSGIQDNSVRSKDVKDGTLRLKDMRPGAVNRLHGQDGVADVNAGANYSHTWAGDNGATLNTIVSKCDEGQVALGGGFSTWGGADANESGLAYDLGGDNKDIQVTVSAPYTGKQYDEHKYHGGILPDRWVVKGFNNGTTDQIVRAWVVCADAS